MIDRRAMRLKEKLAKGGVCAGIWISIADPMACEVIAGTGYDWILVDAEHAPFNLETLHHMLLAFKGSPTVPMIRVPANDPTIIKQILDMGWEGILAPQVNSIADVHRAIEAVRYPPLGKRGYGPRRVSNFYRDMDEYSEIANELVILAIQIEDVTAATQMDEIVKIKGYDWVFVGRCDMSGTAGKFLDVESDEIWNSVKNVFRAAKNAGKPFGGAVGGAGSIEQALELGCNLINVGEDLNFLKDGADNSLKTFNQVLKTRAPQTGNGAETRAEKQKV